SKRVEVRHGGEIRAPGMYPRHYAPRARVLLVGELSPEQAGLALGRATGESQILMPDDPAGYAHRLYGALHELDRMGVGVIHVQAPPYEAEWAAVWDRLRRAAG